MYSTFGYALLFTFCTFFVHQSNQWGMDGHKIIASIAYNRLTETAQKSVATFIPGNALPDIASLPDDFNHTPNGKWSASFHYCNLPRDATEFLMSDCPAYCVVKSIKNYTAILYSESKVLNSRCDLSHGVEPCALSFLVHYVADIHQPLHVSYTDDRGANSIEVNFFGQKTNLHSVWDEKIIRKWNNNWYSATKELNVMINDKPMLIKKYLNDMNPIHWADESYDYVTSTVYNFTTSNSRTKELEIGQEYFERSLPIIQERLIAAGVRLANLLNIIFN